MNLSLGVAALTPFRLVVLVLASGVVAQLGFGRALGIPDAFRRSLLPRLVAFLFLCSVSLLWSPDLPGALTDLAAWWIAIIVVLFCAAQARGVTPTFSHLQLGWVLAGLVLSGVGWWEILTGNHLSGPWIDRAPWWIADSVTVGTLGNPNNYAMGLVVSLIFGAIAVRDWPAKSRLVVISVSAFAVVPLFRTGSRTAVVALGLCLLPVLVGLLPRRGGMASRVSAVLSLALLIGAMGWYGLDSWSEDVSPLSTVADVWQNDASVRVRSELLKVFDSVPPAGLIFGTGPGSFDVQAEAVTRVGQGVTAAHNSGLEIAVQYGLPALVIWISVLGSLLRRVWRMDPQLSYVIGVLLLAGSIATSGFHGSGIHAALLGLLTAAAYSPSRARD